eukprot:scaffold7544_cov107-Isochrysis_galbana.AAC.13
MPASVGTSLSSRSSDALHTPSTPSRPRLTYRSRSYKWTRWVMTAGTPWADGAERGRYLLDVAFRATESRSKPGQRGRVPVRPQSTDGREELLLVECAGAVHVVVHHVLLQRHNLSDALVERLLGVQNRLCPVRPALALFAAVVDERVGEDVARAEFPQDVVPERLAHYLAQSLAGAAPGDGCKLGCATRREPPGRGSRLLLAHAHLALDPIKQLVGR